uniref:Uncharacterized protein n=1 Tax=Anguilla anguilla TaxID=7936 RepID=A0A0E9R3K2_ANGAN
MCWIEGESVKKDGNKKDYAISDKIKGLDKRKRFLNVSGPAKCT